MKRNVKAKLAPMLASALALSLLAACSNGGNGGNAASGTAASGTNSEASASGSAAATQTAGAAGEKTPEPLTLNIMLWGDKPKQFDEVVAEFERRTKDTLNLKLKVTFTPQADYVNKLKLKLSAGEQVDIAFDAPWMNMNAFIAKDSYTNLDGYFNNDQYPGLQKAFGSGYLENNKFTGTDGQLHTYGMPLGQYLSDMPVIYYRKDLAAKYGMSDIKSFEDLTAYFDQVLANDKNMIPFVIRNDGNYGATAAIDFNKDLPVKYEAGLWDLNLAPNVVATLQLDGKTVKGVKLTGDKQDSAAAFPAPFNQPDYTTYQTIREWHDKGYIEKEPIVRKDARGTFTAGKAASMMEGVANLDAVNAQLKAGVPSAELGMFVVQKTVRDMVQPNPTLISDFRVWNFLCIPKTSANADRAMAFINWIFENQDNHDLFELGIKGKNWEPVGDDKFKYPDGIDTLQNYTFPGYMLTWNPNYIRLSANVPDDLVAYYRYVADEKSYVRSALAGFAFNQDPVKNQLANPDFAKISTETLAYQLGMVETPAAGMQKLQAKWESNKTLQSDIAAIKAELKKQVEAFLAQQSGT
ncbi:ABC transporter substrate-binding protein [Cohnella ginsengisoli]|uniref:ABC transporter substrate-binding protein n=1 Tax=Cohnella ginsengisoli TaxID=425004 RepID=A0A9X4KF42_9BACL|nr:extracellular solute-binding protein [Cohnella ginsengisoli]MDG0790841.1 ABC transporter substrate-binding protein [Cohnella ginsengisoli]